MLKLGSGRGKLSLRCLYHCLTALGRKMKQLAVQGRMKMEHESRSMVTRWSRVAAVERRVVYFLRMIAKPVTQSAR